MHATVRVYAERMMAEEMPVERDNLPEAAALAEPAASSPAEPTAPADFDLDTALAEFDRATQHSDSSRNEDAPEALEALEALIEGGQDRQPAAPQRSVDEVLASQRQLWELQQSGEQSARHIEALERSIAEMQRAEYIRQEYADFDKAVAKFEEGLKEFDGLPANYVRDFLMARGVGDPVVRDAFDNRRANPRLWDNVQRQLSADLYRIANERPDPDLTENRKAVAAAILKGASRSEVPTGPPPDMSNMSDSEYRRYTQSQWGFQAV